MSFVYNKKMVFAIFAAIFFIFLDRLFKNIALVYSGKKLIIWQNLLSFNLAKNEFIAFSIPFTGFLLNLLILAIVIMGLVFTIYCFQKRLVYVYFLIFIVAGAASNLFDRIQYGYVIDYIDLKYFTVFNISDIMIVIGSFALLFLLTKKSGLT